MARQIIEKFNPEYGWETEGWFDRDRARSWCEETRWDGNNNVSVQANSRHGHEELYRTAQGRWVKHSWYDWQDSRDRWEYVDDDAAHEWFLKGDDHEAIAEFFPDTPDEIAYGRPEVGPQVVVRMPEELRDRIDAAAAKAGMKRAEWIRRSLETVLA